MIYKNYLLLRNVHLYQSYDNSSSKNQSNKTYFNFCTETIWILEMKEYFKIILGPFFLFNKTILNVLTAKMLLIFAYLRQIHVTLGLRKYLHLMSGVIFRSLETLIIILLLQNPSKLGYKDPKGESYKVRWRIFRIYSRLRTHKVNCSK